MSKIQTLTCILLGILSALMVLSLTILILPLPEHYRFLIAAFIFPVVSTGFLIQGFRTNDFARLVKIYGSITAISYILILIHGPLSS